MKSINQSINCVIMAGLCVRGNIDSICNMHIAMPNMYIAENFRQHGFKFYLLIYKKISILPPRMDILMKIWENQVKHS